MEDRKNDHIQFKLQFQNKSSGEADHFRNLRSLKGQRLDSTKSCTAEIGYNSFGDLDKSNSRGMIPDKCRFKRDNTDLGQTQLFQCQSFSNDLSSQPNFEKTKDNSNRPLRENDVSQISNDSCFKVPRSVLKGGRNLHQQASGEYGIHQNSSTAL